MEMHQPVLREPRFPLSIAGPKTASGFQLRFDSLSALTDETFPLCPTLEIAPYSFSTNHLISSAAKQAARDEFANLQKKKSRAVPT